MGASDVKTTIREVMKTVDQSAYKFPKHKTGIRYAVVDPIL